MLPPGLMRPSPLSWHIRHVYALKPVLRKERESARKRVYVCERECVCACIQALMAYIAMICVCKGERRDGGRGGER